MAQESLALLRLLPSFLQAHRCASFHMAPSTSTSRLVPICPASSLCPSSSSQQVPISQKGKSECPAIPRDMSITLLRGYTTVLPSSVSSPSPAPTPAWFPAALRPIACHTGAMQGDPRGSSLALCAGAWLCLCGLRCGVRNIDCKCPGAENPPVCSVCMLRCVPATWGRAGKKTQAAESN